MTEANFQGVFLGIETPSKASLRETKKYQNLRRDILEQVRLIQSRGLWVVAGFIVGFDSDGDSIFDDQEEFIRCAGIPCAAMNLLQAIPTTPLYERLKREGRLNDSDPVLMVPSELPNFRTVMPPNRLLSGMTKLLRNLYDPDQFFERGIRSLEYWTPTAHQRFQRFSLSYALVWMLRSFWIQGVRSHYRHAYWRFLGEVVKRWWREPVRLEQGGAILMWAHHLFRYYGDMASRLESELRNLTDSTASAARSLEVSPLCRAKLG